MSEESDTQDDSIPLALGIYRIILLDSYLPGTRSELIIDGHVAITGANSAGKTSLIRLLPLFFGAEPQNLVKSGGDNHRKPFADYYFPTRASHVVFEYRTVNGLNLAVFTSNKSNGITPTLITGEYDDALFMADDDSFLEADGLTKRARAAGRQHVVVPSHKEYRNTLFGNPRRIAGTGLRSHFNVLRGHANTNASLVDVHRILSATIDGQPPDERLLRRLLLDNALNGLGAQEDQISRLGVRVEDLQGWLNNAHSLSRLRDRHGRVIDVMHAADKATESARQNAALLEAAAQRQQVQADEHKQLDRDQTELEETAQRLRAAHEATEQEFSDKRSEQTKRLRNARDEKDRLDNRESDYQRGGIEQASQQAEQVEARRIEADQRRTEYNLLKTKSKDIDTEFDAEQTRRKEVYDKERDRQARARREQEDELNARAARQQQTHREAIDAQSERQQDEAERLNDARTHARSEVARLEASVKHIGADADVQRAREKAEHRLDDARRAADQAQNAFSEDERAGRRAREELISAADSRARRTKQRDECKRDVEKLTEKLERTGTLLSFMRDQTPDNSGYLAAVLERGPDLLYEKNLAPRVTQHSHESLLGIAFDNARFNPVDIDRDERQRLDKRASELPELEEGLNKAQRRERQAEREKKTTAEKVAESELNHNRAAKQAKLCAENLGKARREEARSRETNQASAQQALDQANTDLKTADDQCHAAKVRHDQDKKALRATHESEQTALVDQRTAIAKKFDAEAKQATDAFENDRQEIERLRAAKRTEKGIDTEAIAAAEQRAGDAKLEFDRASQAKRQVVEYAAFREDFEARMPSLIEVIENASADLRALKSEWERAKTQHDREKGQADSQRRRLLIRMDTIESDQRELARALEHESRLDAEPLPGMADEWAKQTGARISEQLDDGLQALKDVRSTLTNGLTEIDRTLRERASGMCWDFAERHALGHYTDAEWPKLIEDANHLRALYGAPDDWANNQRYFPPDSYGKTVEQAVRGINNQTLTLSGFVRRIRSIGTAIARQSRDLQTRFQRVLDHLDSITELRVECSFEHHRIPGYEAAQRFHKALDAYVDQRNNSGDDNLLPGREVSEAVESLLHHLQAQTDQDTANAIDAVGMTFAVRLSGDKTLRTFRTGQSMTKELSGGMGPLVVLIVLVGFMQGMRDEMPITTPWMLDELLKLDAANSRQLLEALREQRIFLMTTSPDLRPEANALFARHYVLQSLAAGNEQADPRILIEIEPSPPRNDPFKTVVERSEVASNE